MDTRCRGAKAAGALAAVLAIAGCAGAPDRTPPPAHAQAMQPFPSAFYQDPPEAGRVFRLDPARSRLEVLVFRAGALARRGHNHLLRARAFEGAVFLAADGAGSRMDLRIPVAEFEVDPPHARAAAGAAFAAAMDEDARRGTRGNLLGPKVLDAASHPVVSASATVAAGELPWLLLELELMVRGHAHAVAVPVHVELEGPTLRARGMLALRHAELGLEPFQALGGLLAVADPLLLRVDLVGIAEPGASR